MANLYQNEQYRVSAGQVYSIQPYCLVAVAEGGKVLSFRQDIQLTDRDKEQIKTFAAEAHEAAEKE